LNHGEHSDHGVLFPLPCLRGRGLGRGGFEPQSFLESKNSPQRHKEHKGAQSQICHSERSEESHSFSRGILPPVFTGVRMTALSFVILCVLCDFVVNPFLNCKDTKARRKAQTKTVMPAQAGIRQTLKESNRKVVLLADLRTGFKHPTVLILGAGASWHYGYPTGEVLVQKIIKKAKEMAQYIEGMTPDIKAHCTPDFGKWDDIKVQCHDLAKHLGYVNPLLIDYFLESNEVVRAIGKLMVAWVTLECEAKYNWKDNGGNINRKEILENSPLKSERKDAEDIIYLKGYRDDWCRFVLHKLTSDRDENSKLSHNNVTFVTFNYDVSLETALYKGLGSSGLEKKEIRDFLLDERFLHIYGKVGGAAKNKRNPLPLFSQMGRQLQGAEKDLVQHHKRWLDDSFQASKNLKTIGGHEKHENKDVIDKAKAAIQGAQVIYILGYGFDRRNNDLLELKNVFQGRQQTDRKVFFTNFENRNSINKKASELFFGRDDGFLPPTYIRNTANDREGFYSGNMNYYEKSIRDVYQALEQDFDFV
jgi:hypothetical protein